MTHLLVTNDFPPKIGGIQSYLWELWRRLPAESFAVLTTPHDGADTWDRRQPFRVVRTREPVLLPNPWLVRRINALAGQIGADLVLLDPALPLGAVGRHLSRPYGLVVHGAEVTVPGRLVGTRQLLGHVLRGAKIVVAAGGYPAAESRRAAGGQLPIAVVPPGVDVERFHPLDEASRSAARRRLGLPEHAMLIVGMSRMVPRKGFDILIRAAAQLRATHPDVLVVLSGTGRDVHRLQRIATESGAAVRFLGRVPDADVAPLLGCADLFAMLCRNRWRGLEQEGFGIVFVEAAAAGLPQIAGRSGGAAEAVVHGETGLVVDDPNDMAAVVGALVTVLDDEAVRRRMGLAARHRAETELSYDVSAAALADALRPLAG